jgi:Domain of unknown function (DUF4910)
MRDNTDSAFSAPDFRRAGERMYTLAGEMFPICRSLTANSVRTTLNVMRRRIPFDVHEMPKEPARGRLQRAGACAAAARANRLAGPQPGTRPRHQAGSHRVRRGDGGTAAVRPTKGAGAATRPSMTDGARAQARVCQLDGDRFRAVDDLHGACLPGTCVPGVKRPCL